MRFLNEHYNSHNKQRLIFLKEKYGEDGNAIIATSKK